VVKATVEVAFAADEEALCSRNRCVDKTAATGRAAG